jgi:hypothetical protein
MTRRLLNRRVADLVLVSEDLIAPPHAPADPTWAAAVTAPGQPLNIISRTQWGADESMRCGTPVYDNGIKAGIVHRTAGSNQTLRDPRRRLAARLRRADADDEAQAPADRTEVRHTD